MADITKTIEIIFGGKNELGNTLDDIGRNLDDLAGKPDKLNVSLSSVAKKVLEIDAGLAAMVVGGLAYAIKSAGDFEESFDRVALRINASSGEIEKFRGDVLAYGTDSSRSLADINAALAESIQRGTNYKDAIDQLATAEHLAIATHSDLKSSTVLLSTVMNAYGASVSEAAHYGDIFTQGVKIGAGEIPQLSEEMGKIAGIAHGMGIPLETLVAALSALGAYGVDTSTALGGLKFMLSNLLDPSKEARAEADKLGISFSAQAVKTKGLEVVMKEAYTATKGNAEMMKTLFGSVRGLNVAFDLAGDSQGKFKTALDATRSSTGVMQKEYDEFVNDFHNVNQRLKNSFTSTLAEIGLKLMPEYGKIAGAMGDLMKGIKVGVDAGAFDPLFKYLDQVGASIAIWLKGIAASFPDALKMIDFSGLVDALQDLGEAFGKMLSGGTSENIAGIIQDVVDSIETLIRVTQGIGEVFVPIGKTILEAVKAFNGLDDSTKSIVGNLMGFGLAYKMFGPLSIAMIAFGTDTAETGRIFAWFAAGLDNGVNLIKVALLGMALVFEKGVLAANELLGVLPGYDNTEGIKRAATNVKTLSYELDQAENKLYDSTDKIYALFDGTDAGATKAKKSVKELADEAAKITGKKMLEIIATLDPKATSETQWAIAQAFKMGDINQVKMLVSLGNEEAKAAADKLKVMFPETKTIGIQVLPDGTSIETTKDMIIKTFPDGTIYMTNIGTKADDDKLAATKKKFDDAFPKEKTTEIMAKLDADKIKAQAETIQKAVEWKGKLDIAQVEAETARLKTMFESINTAITSTGTTLSSELNSLTSAYSAGKGGTSFIEQQISNENTRRDNTFTLQKNLTEAQIANIKARTEATNRGDSIIKIDGTRLAPHLEAFMFAVLAAIQVRVNEEYGDFLVGIK
jgi:TP901 family phage tail tape measure protein